MDKVVGPAVIAVHGAQVPPDKVPLLVSVPRHVLVLGISGQTFTHTAKVGTALGLLKGNI